MPEKNIIPYSPLISLAHRHRRNRHGSGLLWFMGLSGSGKSTLAHAVDLALFNSGAQSFVLDGDNIRTGLNRDLGLGEGDRKENIRRIAEVAKLMAEGGLLVLSAFITPYEESRRQIAEIVRTHPYYLVYCRCSLRACQSRDPKGLYAKALKGEIKNMTGMGSPFQEPLDANLVVDTEAHSVEESTLLVLDFMRERGLISGPACDLPPAGSGG